MSNPVTETAVFNGNTYTRYPESKRRQHRVYFQYHDKWKAAPRYLHRDIWIFRNGPIPKGYEIHHHDGNPLNNTIENFRCVTKAEHRKLDAERGAYDTPAVKANLNRIRHLTVAWHKSEEGRKWHSENAKKCFANRVATPRPCKQCKKEFLSVFKDAAICGPNCAQKVRRDSGLDDVERLCQLCQSKFKVNKYKKTKTCSSSCGNKVRWATRRAK